MERRCRFPRIHHLHFSPFVSYGFLVTGLFLISINICGTYNAFKDPGSTSKELNLLFYATSRVSYVFGLSCLILNMFLGNTTRLKAMLSDKLNRVISKSLAVGCVIQIIIIDVVYLSFWSAPNGIAISWPNIIQYFVGLVLITPVVSVMLMMLVELPIIRLL